MTFLNELELGARQIRDELRETYRLTAEQVTALPTVEKLTEFAFASIVEIQPLFMDNLTFFPGSNKLDLNKAQQNQLAVLTGIGVLAAYSSFIYDPDCSFSSGRDSMKREILHSYKEICTTIITERDKPSLEKSPIGRFLSNYFPIPAS